MKKIKLLVCLCTYGFIVFGQNSTDVDKDGTVHLSLDFGANGPNYSYVDMEGVVSIPPWDMVNLWATNRTEYIKQRRSFLEQEKMKARIEIAKITDEAKLCDYLNKCSIDPFAEKLIVPLHYYEKWLFAKRTRPWESYLIGKAKEHAFFAATDVHGNMVSGNPAYYAALDAYEGPTKDDLIRWLKTDPRIEKLGYSVLWTSYKFGHFSDSFYHELTRDIIVNWTNLYVRCSAVQVLYNLEGGDTELEKIKKDHDLPGGLLAVINGTMSRDHLALRWRGTAPLWEKKKGSADDPSR